MLNEGGGLVVVEDKKLYTRAASALVLCELTSSIEDEMPLLHLALPRLYINPLLHKQSTQEHDKGHVSPENTTSLLAVLLSQLRPLRRRCVLRPRLASVVHSMLDLYELV
jgi:hypothetical protein